MKVVAFNGSPRKDGNTELLLRKVLEPIAAAGIETEIVQVGGTTIRGCLACGKCIERKDKRCAVTSDIFNDCMGKMIEADAIICGSPTYFADMTSEMKALIDRSGFVARVNGFLFARKIGAAVVAVRRGGAIHVFDSINHMFFINKMIVPGSTYWNFAFGLGRGEVVEDKEGVENMRDLGETITWLAKTTAEGRAASPAASAPNYK